MDPSGLPPLLALVGLALAVAAYQAVRRPVQRRLALRDLARRRGETLLVIAGSLLGTALITGSFIVGDTLDASIRATAVTQLGPVDETITTPDRARAADIEERVRALDDPRIDGVASLVAVSASFSAGAGGDRLAEPDGQLLELDFAEARAFGGDPDATGISGATPGPGRAVVTEDLAARLDLMPGDEFAGYLLGGRVSLEVDRVVPTVGLAGYWRGVETTSPNAFVAPGTIAGLARAGAPAGAVPPQTTVLVSNRGDVESGAALTQAVTAAIERDVIGERSLRVEPVKKDTLDAADVQGDSFSSLFVSIGSFAIIAGVLLLVNIFVMLAEERKNQLGMLRAVGMRRSDLVRTFSIQGAVYALTAGALGAIAGIGVGWAIVKLAAPIFYGAGEFSLTLLFDMEPPSIVGGFCAGVLISLATVFGTSVRISRINIIRAIRDLPEPRAGRVRRRTMAAGVVLGAAGAAWFIPSLGDDRAWAPAILGPAFVAWGIVPLAARLVGRRAPVLAASALSLAWGIFGNDLTDGQFFDAGEMASFVFQGLLLTFSAVVLLSQTQEVLEGAFRRLAARRLSLRLGLAYPLARRFRTGLTLGMFSLVIFTMVFIAEMSVIFSNQVSVATRHAGGGFDVFASASDANPPRESSLEDVRGVADAATLVHGTPLFQPEGAPAPEPWFVSGIDEGLVAAGAPSLEERLPALSSDRAAWARLLEDHRAMIIDPFFLTAGGGFEAIVTLGDEVRMIDPITGAAATREVIGIASSGVAFTGAFMARPAVEQVLGERAAAARFYVDVEDGADAAAVARRIQGRFLEEGVEARTFRALVEDDSALSLQFLRLMQGYLALGLLVGIAGLGVVMVRAVRERRRQVGVLRSLGFLPRQIRRAFLLESGFVAVEGIAVGTVLALVTASQLVANGDFGEGLSFAIPWLQLLIITGSAALASVLATAWPAQQASRIAPAVALRIAE
ncbi:MAG TPA: FtsX-like permease family protein [Actinomycetota bacterium]|nr:FtsX-like permease family protein [Actinomycetota bacterium]